MKFVNLEVQDYIGIVTINHPPVNAMNTQTYQELAATFKSINDMDQVRVVILRAEGKIFVAGNDIGELGELNEENIVRYREMVKDSTNAIYDCKVPVIGAIQGAAMGIGLAYAACCDILIASEKAVFGIPEIKIGIVGAAEFLALLVPRKVVTYMALTGQPISAQEVFKYGGVHKVVPNEQLMEAATELAELLLGNPPLIMQDFKEAMHINANARLGEMYDVEVGYTMANIKKHDFKEAISALMQKRKPVYKGE